MSTALSPDHVLQSQANSIAAMLFAAERGEKIDVRFAEKIEAARGKETIKVGVVMDDKIFTIEITWAKIRETGEAELAAYIFGLMRGTRYDA